MEKNKEYIVTIAKLSKTRDGRTYGLLDLIGEVDGVKVIESVSVWGMDTTPNTPCVVEFNSIKNNGGKWNCSLGELMFKQLTDDNPLSKYVPRIVTREAWDDLRKFIEFLIEEEEFKRIWSSLSDRMYLPYSTRVGGRSMHHAYKGGLLNHTYEILKMFGDLYYGLHFKVEPFVFAISALFHDYYKLYEYDKDNNTTPSMHLIGHPFGSAEAIGKILRENKVDAKTVMYIQHCVLSHHGALEYGSPVLPATPEAMLLSRLDELSATGEQFEKTPTGGKVKDVIVYHYKDFVRNGNAVEKN